MYRTSKTVLVTCLALALAGCSSATNKQKGAVIGGTTGAVVGGVVGKQAGNTAAGAIIGAVVGGTAGVIIGGYMDKQAEELAELEGAEVERVGEGIMITFDSGILFDFDKSDLTTDAKLNLRKMATTLNEYEDTNILIEGHTDSDGSDEYNQGLSERRASSVKTYLTAQSVDPGRMTTVGYGENQPIADNSSSAGKAQNRRVEVAIFANEELKQRAIEEAAQKG
jgi:outer membrane protein OmpA-like peptidoglycan-associated protein